jgi:hypothetical protein
MWKSIAGWVSNQVRSERRKLSDAELSSFAGWLPAARVEQVLEEEGAVASRECCYSPLITLWTFLSQVLSPDHSCREAVARLRAFLTCEGQSKCSPGSGPYCKARQRLPENACARLAREAGRHLHEQVQDTTLLLGRPIKLVDGTTVSMPDTPANQAAYPQLKAQKPGLGFPLVRLVALLSLASGAVLDVAFAPYEGKNTGEPTLFRQLWRSLFSGDVVVGDRYFASYWDLALLAMCGVDSVYRQHQLRLTREQRIKRLGDQDYLLRLPRPTRPDWMDADSYARVPAEIVVREVTIQVRVPGFRVNELTLVTTLCDAQLVTRQELGRVYRTRWQAELDLRTIKVTMQMEILRCKTPEMVRKEIWMHLLAYNLIRTVMSEAASRHSLRPREVSFTGAWQTLLAYRPLMEQASLTSLTVLYDDLLKTIAYHRVGDRPNRYEPRAIKRRPKSQALLMVPREEAKRLLAA